MSLAWHVIRDHLMRSSATFRFQQSLETLRSENPALQQFTDPAAVLEYLHRSADAPERKNDVLRALVAAAQIEKRADSCAQTLLLLALWPGLDAVRRRLTWRWKHAPEEAAADVLAAACHAISKMELARVNRIAATLLRNVERDIGRTLQREAGRQQLHTTDDPEELQTGASGERPCESAAYLAREVESLIGPDARIVLSVALEGLTQAEAGAALGLSEPAARKRFQRVAHRLRDALQEIH